MIILHLYSQKSLLHTDDKQGQYKINMANTETSCIGPVLSRICPVGHLFEFSSYYIKSLIVHGSMVHGPCPLVQAP